MMESMSDFFAARVEGYDAHMLEEVEGCREGYEKMAQLAPEGIEKVLDLGCGTGLELEPLFQRFPDIQVTGIDLTREMLECLKAKFPEKRLTLIEGDYFATEFGEETFDLVISFQTMHHFSKEKKLGLYQKIFRALKPGGQYLECDYMVWWKIRRKKRTGLPKTAGFGRKRGLQKKRFITLTRHVPSRIRLNCF